MSVKRYHDIKDKFSVFENKIITEKIDGSNLGIGMIEKKFQLQSRNLMLEETTKQFKLNEIIQPLKKIVENLSTLIPENFIIFGEIFGHLPRIKYHDNQSAKVFRSKNVFFRAFDLYLPDSSTFKKYSDAIEYFEKIGLPYMPILDLKCGEKKGDLYSQLRSFKSEFSDEVEGFVVKKNETENLKDRKIFKIKNIKFVESLNKKALVNSNIFVNARSKVGTDKDSIKKEMVRDIMKEVEKAVDEYVEKYYDSLIN